ncbi:MAG: hypothetical protein RLN88_13555 [Ekhidna sp.]|uniref:hypothetical protein n=1 Tax=Ekhidna sp. TaxID=2608089 RepID=UPI0032EC9B70
MTTFKDFFLSFFESARERLKNPVIGTFIFAWSALNWRIIFILILSDTTIEERIELIENCYLDIWLNLYVPLIVTAFYLIVLPYILALFDWLSQRAIALRKLISKNHRIADIQHKQEIAAEEWQLEIIREGSPDISRLKEQIAELQEQLKEKDYQIKKLIDNEEPDVDESLEPSGSDNSEESPSKPKTKKKTTRKRTESKETSTPTKPVTKSHPKDLPVMRDIVIRDLPKTESEWILIYAFYTSDYGKSEFRREDLLVKYDESNRRTQQRVKNLTQSIRTLIKQGLIKYINDDDMFMTDVGINKASDILNR